MKLTERDLAPYVNLNSLIHIVNTGDTSQSLAGSSYKTPLSSLLPIFGGNDFIHKYIVYVDPNGDDATGEFGNKNKPFKSLSKALLAAATFMDNPSSLDSDWFVYNNGLSTTIPAEPPLPIYYEIPQVEIEVFPGLYNTENEPPLNIEIIGGTNLLYNGIIWNFHKGAILLNYSWSDFNNIVDDISVETNRPVRCTVTGEGTFISTGGFGGGLIYVGNTGTTFNFKADVSHYNITVNAGVVNYAVRKHKPSLIFGEFGSNINIEGGILNFKADLVQWAPQVRPDFDNRSFIYQGGGKLNIDINKYFETCLANKPVTGIDDLTYLNTISAYVESGAPFPNDGSWLFTLLNEEITYPGEYYNENKDGYAPNLGYFEEYDPTYNPSTTNISINYGKFKTYAIEIGGGEITYETKLTEINVKPKFSNPIGIFAYVGGPYYEDARLKFSVLGGKIKFLTDGNIITESAPFITNFYVYDDGPQVYINNTRFLVSDQFDSAWGFWIEDGGWVNPNQTSSFILDSVKLMTEYVGEGYFYNFYIDNSGNPYPIKIYGNCFSNYPAVYDLAGDPVTNLIPSTNLIIDNNIQII